MKKSWQAALFLGLTLAFVFPACTDQSDAHGAGRHMQGVYPANPQIKNGDAISFRPIGYFHTPYHTREETPHQGPLAPDIKATIELAPAYRKGLKGLEKFQYIIVLYYFDRIRNWSPVVKPPWASQSFGIFSTRTPRRPNPIGMSVIKLKSIDMQKGVLHVSGVDAFDNTPVLDIKPYLPFIDNADAGGKSQLSK